MVPVQSDHITQRLCSRPAELLSPGRFVRKAVRSAPWRMRYPQYDYKSQCFFFLPNAYPICKFHTWTTNGTHWFLSAPLDAVISLKAGSLAVLFTIMNIHPAEYRKNQVKICPVSEWMNEWMMKALRTPETNIKVSVSYPSIKKKEKKKAPCKLYSLEKPPINYICISFLLSPFCPNFLLSIFLVFLRYTLSVS